MRYLPNVSLNTWFSVRKYSIYFLLLAVHPAHEDNEEELPRLQNEVHGRPDDGAKGSTPPCALILPFVDAGGGRELHLSPPASHTTDVFYMSAEYFDRTRSCFCIDQDEYNLRVEFKFDTLPTIAAVTGPGIEGGADRAAV